MLNRSTVQGIRLGIAVILASFAGQAMAGTYLYGGTATVCLDTCDGFDSLSVGSVLGGRIAIDVGESDIFAAADVGDFAFTVTNPALPLVPFDGTNPDTANPLPIVPAIAAIRETGFGGATTGGTTDADGELASGTLLFEFVVPPFSDNQGWVVIDVGTGTAQVCVGYLSFGCIPGATETVVIAGSFGLQPALEAYTQDFESLLIAEPAALADDGWLVFGNVFDSGGGFLFGYGPFTAPNGGPAFSAIVADEGGAPQGDQQLSVYNDYNCCGTTDGHFDGTHLVESNVFQEQLIGFDDVGATWQFSFDAKLGNLEGSTTALAFIKTLDPNDGFALTNFVTVDMTSIPTTWSRYSLSLTIDASLVGQILQIGYSSTASNFAGSGVFYDNIGFVDFDADRDGVLDDVDNCTFVANPGQEDTNGDGIGNICDADFNNDCSVNLADLSLMKANFFQVSPDYDLNSSGGAVNLADLSIMKALFFQPPGPSATPCVLP